MKYISLILLGALSIIILSSFFGGNISEKRKIASNLIYDFARMYESTYGLKFCGFSEAAPKGKYENLGLDFNLYRKVTKHQARKLLVKIQSEFLGTVNNSSELRDYLHVFPFTGHNIVINVYVYSHDGSEIVNPEIGSFSIYNDQLRYRKYPDDFYQNPSQPIVEIEFLSEALKLLDKAQ